ncbi:hypothetical protein TNCT_191301 [Trichonephila clavata]|uniref:Uncharacterized protein n=1 Tax=Trichonephila clavata TaxID=2740835 RepID=A0A8X6KJZ8_TRICU|nr:hypothetical protein TNCT_191301 [Trichonephila clavata]
MQLKQTQRAFLWLGILPSLEIEEAAESSLLVKMASRSSKISPSDALFVTSGLKLGPNGNWSLRKAALLWRLVLSYGCRKIVQSTTFERGSGVGSRHRSDWVVPPIAIPPSRKAASRPSFAPFQNMRQGTTAHYGAKTYGMLLKRRLWLLS